MAMYRKKSSIVLNTVCLMFLSAFCLASTASAETVACLDLDSGEILDSKAAATVTANVKENLRCGCKPPSVAAGCEAHFTRGNCEWGVLPGPGGNMGCVGECKYAVLCAEKDEDFEASKKCSELKRPTRPQ